jgi:hypothetical protein
MSDNWLAGSDAPAYGHFMSTQEIAEAVMSLPQKDRLDLARRIVTDVLAERETLTGNCFCAPNVLRAAPVICRVRSPCRKV